MTTQPSDPPPPVVPAVSPITPDERTWGTMAHVSSLIAMFLGGLSALGPLIVWLMKKNESAFVAHHGREALNFQLTMLVLYGVLAVATFATCGLGWIVFWPILGIASLANVVLSIIGAVRANDSQLWKYPLSLRLVN
jgi:uncharacterized Tic20 family protein